MYTTKGKNKNLDKATMVIGLCMPLVTLPQLFTVWHAKSLAGVSLITWAFYTLQCGIFSVFGIKHKEKPLIFTYIPLFIIELGIVIGLVIRKY
ncbi:MAG TPA: hypothetical protein VIJ68_01305 [Candidatus Saccharimonadales bacterium]